MKKQREFHSRNRLRKKLRRVMKLTTLLILSIVMSVHAASYSQVTKLNLTLNDESLVEALKQIEDQSDYYFYYNNDDVIGIQSLSVNIKGKEIQKVLDQLLDHTDLDYKMIDRYIVIKKSDATSSPDMISQPKNISGKVTDANGGSLPGVTVVIKGTMDGTITDIDGNYTLTEIPENTTLIFSFVGMKSQEIPVLGENNLNVVLEEETIGLEEVVAIGYGTQKKSSVTGAISSVSGEDISHVPVASVQSALQGKAAGVTVVNNGGPGTAPIVRIRGNGSISYAADPLYIIDGTPASDITNFDSNDIESIEILKDASSTAVYGSRAANGVVLITTKKGKKDNKMHINIDSYAGVQSVRKTLDLLNTEQYIQYGTALNTNAGLAVPPRFSNMDEPIYDGATQTYAQTNTDWQDALFQDAMITDNSISFSTGSEKSIYYASAGYLNQDGIMVGTSYERGNFRFNSEHEIGKRIKFGQTLMYSYGYKNNEKEDMSKTNIMHTIRSVPYLPVTDPTKDGGYRGASSGSDGTDPLNPVLIQKLFKSTSGTSKLFATFYLEFNIADFLRFKATAGLENTNIRNKEHLPIYNDGFNASSSATVTREIFDNVTKTFTNQLTFDKTWGNHYLNVIAVQEQTAFSTNTMYTTGNLSTNTVQELTGLRNINANGSKEKNLLLSYMGRINYEYKNKYLLSVSFREDGSSKFAPGNKWGSFPSAAIGWRMTQEPFMENAEIISQLKLRAGYGELGNNAIGNYDWQSVIMANTEYVLNNGTVGGSYFDALANKNLKWESSKMTNIGIDFGMYENKITFTAEWFNKKTDNLILAVPYPASIGYYAPAYANVGKMKNYGMEFQVGYRINSGDLKSSLSANLSIIRNKVLSLTNETATIDSGQDPDYGAYDMTRTIAGKPIQSFYGWKTDGIFQNPEEVVVGPVQVTGTSDANRTAPGDIRFKDLSGPDGKPDGIVDSYDRTFLGSYLPKFTYGLNYSGNYKRFDFSVFLQGVYGNKIYNAAKVLTQGMLRLFNAGTEVLDAWTPSNTNTNIPRAISGDPNQNARTSDRFIEKGSYLRLKTLTIGYTMPMDALTKGNVTEVRFYASGQNLLTLTNYDGYDPEVGAYSGNGIALLNNGIDYGMVPTPRTILGGIQINF